MRSRQSSASRLPLTRLIGIALLAGTAAGCSSDANRFAYKSTDELLTASVPAPASDTLAPVGLVPPSGVGQAMAGQAPGYPAGAYPAATYPVQQAQYPQNFPAGPAAAPQAVSQAFPGDYRQPMPYDPASTGSVPGAVVRSAANPRSLLPAAEMPSYTGAAASLPATARPAVRTAGAVAAIPAAVTAPAARLAPAQPVQNAAASLSQPFPARPVTAPATASIAADDDFMTPDPITTGSSPAMGSQPLQGNGWTTAGATQVSIRQGETIYNLSKRYGVPASEIMKANGISDPSKVAVGQKVLIPVYVYSRQAPVSAPDADPRTMSARAGTGLVGEANPNRAPMPQNAPSRETAAILPSVPQPRTPQSAPSQQPGTLNASNRVTEPRAPSAATAMPAGTYTVKSGDTLTKIARANGVSIDALKAANNIGGSNIRIGQKLVIPEAGAAVPDRTQTASVQPSANASALVQQTPRSYTPPVQSAEDSVAAKTKADTASVAPASTGIGKLRWPARGQVITGFAKTEDGKRNDGIDISMPAGSPVKAAENGVVIYAGDGLKDYGNTVLVRHDDGLVTVYAHAQTLNVKRGDKVTRGQTVAMSGMSGSAKTPRLHFEVRKNAAPVNPADYLE